MERKQQTARKSRMKELYAVFFKYIMHEEALLTLKEKKKKKMRREGGRVGERFLRPRV